MADEMTNGTNATTDNGTQDNSVDLTALQAELAKFKAENEKLKAAQSNASADASRYKKELASRMSEQEKEAQATKELIEQLKADNEALKRAQSLAEQKAGLVSVGFDGELAEKAATAFIDKDFGAFSAHLKDFITAHDKALNADAIRNTPKPGTGNVGTLSMTKDQFDKLGYAERTKLFNEQPDLYKELSKSE